MRVMPDMGMLKKNYRRQGFAPTMAWTFSFYFGYLRRLGVHYFDVHHYGCDILEDIPDPKPGISVEVEDLSPQHVEMMRPWLPPGKAELFLERLAAGKHGLVCISKGEVVYFTWFTDRDEYDSSTLSWMHLATGEGYLFDSFCRPEFRGRGLHSFMNIMRLRRLREIGCVRALGRVFTTNFSSRWTLVAAGFQPINRVVSIGFGRRLMRIKLQPLLLKWEKPLD